MNKIARKRAPSSYLQEKADSSKQNLTRVERLRHFFHEKRKGIVWIDLPMPPPQFPGTELQILPQAVSFLEFRHDVFGNPGSYTWLR
jgi:hypothetical protein